MASRRGTPLPRLRADAEATMRSVAQENCVVYFTDGSVDPVHNVAGAAFVTKDEQQGVRVLGTRCSTQAEGVAVGLALTHALNTHQPQGPPSAREISRPQLGAGTHRHPGK
ncbi:uncharacterized protein LOC143040519 [Oratosquilla oratoria]|uniref:uncharacterized protein LOC143020551 n=1 Tax=Oratosquilla oratoria TaxID=337810 RepID=UPI003F763D6A